MPILNSPYSLVTDSTADPVTLAEAKSHLRVTSTGDNDYITDLISVARRQVETDSRRALFTQTWDRWLDCFPNDEIELASPNVASISAITYTATTGNTATVSTSVYSLDAANLPGYARLQYNQSWPTDVRTINKSVKVRFIAGSTATSAVEVEAKHAIKLLVADMYECRGSSIGETPDAYWNLIGMLRWGDYA